MRFMKPRLAALLSISVLTLVGCSTVEEMPEPTPTAEEIVDKDFTGQVNLISDPAEVCKLQEDSRNRKPGDKVQDYSGQLEIRGRYAGNATAFPFAPTALPVSGIIDVALVYVDWSDAPGSQEDFDYYQQQVKMFHDFYWMVSEHKLDLRITSSNQWFRIPGTYKDFTLTEQEEAQRGEAPKKQVFYDAAVATSDSMVDFTGIDLVLFAIPTNPSIFFEGGPHEFNYDFNGQLNTNEGKIYNIAAAGDYFLNSSDTEPPWVYYVHETGHMIGIPHQSNEDIQSETRIYIQNPINGYEIMANQGGAVRTMTAWLRWLAGWLTDDQVTCVDSKSVTDGLFQLDPINLVGGAKKAIVIRLSETMAIVVESRRFDEYFDRKTANSKDGLVVYTVDATKGSAQANQTLLSPRDITEYLVEPSWRSQDELDAIFFEGDKVEFEGLTIEAHYVGSKFDVVRVYKATS